MWQEFLTYPQLLRPSTQRTLDALEQLLPADFTLSDRYVAMADWLRDAESCGLITASEHYDLRSDIAPNL